MERAQMLAVENFINVNWNTEFPDYPLSAADFKKPHAVMGALFQLFDRIGIDREAIVGSPPEDTRNDHTIYYWDLLSVINMTRVINHLVSVLPQCQPTVTITHFLQPTAITTHSILLLLFNLMVFNEDRLRDIAPHEEVLFSKTDQVKSLQDRKNKLLELLNEQAEEKGKRSERLEKIDMDIKQLEEELKEENEAFDTDKQELEAILKDKHQLAVVVEQKKGLKEALLAEVARKRAQRVYDADDIKAQAEQAAQNVQEAEEKLNSLRATLMQKENSLKNLQTIKPSLDTANNLLHEIMKLSESLKDYESGDLDTDSKEGELEVLNTELADLETQLSELRAARADAATKRTEGQRRRQHERMLAESALRDAEERDKKSRERVKRALQRTQEIKELTAKYEEERNTGMEQLELIQNKFSSELKTMEDALLKKAMEAEKRIEEKLRNRSV